MREYYHLDGSQAQQGPFTKEEMHALLDQRRIGEMTSVFRTGDAEWRTAHHYPELAIRKPDSKPSRSVRSSAPEAWVPRSAQSTGSQKDDNQDMRKWGIILVVLGVLIGGYYALVYDTSVKTEIRYIHNYDSLGRVLPSTEIGGERVHNLGRLQNRLVGCIAGVAMASVGSVMLVLSRRR